MAITSKIMGLASLQRRFDKIPAEIKRDVKRQMEQEANRIVAQMKAAAPVDTGNLRNSIKWMWGRPEKKQMVLGGLTSKLGGEMTLTIYAGYTRKKRGNGKWKNRELPIVRWVEFGTQTTKAQPFFYPVYRANKKKTRRAINKAVNQAMKKAVQ